MLRPLAVVTISEIAAIARRLGMTWKQFEPLHGDIRAEGNCHTVSSTIVRSMGTVLSMGFQDPLPKGYTPDNINEFYVPTETADKVGFGIVTGDSQLDIPEEDECLASLRNKVSHEAADTVKSLLAANPGWTPGISDIIGFAAPMMRRLHSLLIRVPAPAG